MKKTSLIIILVLVLIGGFFIFGKLGKEATKFSQTEKKITKDLGLKEGKADVPTYKKAVVDEDKCGKDAFYIEEKSADFVKNYCRFLKDNGWKLVHQDYSTCEDIKSFGGGYNYEKGKDKIAVSVIKYGENATCFWVFKK